MPLVISHIGIWGVGLKDDQIIALLRALRQ
jgi:hypothetical protein